MGCDSPSALMAPTSSQFKDIASPALHNPFLPGAPINPMALPSLDPFFMQRLHSMVNLNMLLASQQQQSPTSPGASPPGYGCTSAGMPPTAASPPLKLPFGGLSHAFFGGGAPHHPNPALLQQQQNNRLLLTALGEKKHSADSLRFKAAKQQADNSTPTSAIVPAV